MTESKIPKARERGVNLSRVDGVSIICIMFGAIIMFGVPFTILEFKIQYMIFGVLLIGLGVFIKHLQIQRQLLLLLKEQNIKENNNQ